MPTQIKLNLINQSQDSNNTQYVIYQKNVATNYEELAIAWRVVQNLGLSDNHPFTYSLEFDVCAEDAWGNFTPRVMAADGEAYALKRTQSGDRLMKDGAAVSAFEVEVRNNLPMGALNACIFRDGKLLARKTGVSPQQKSVFRFNPRIYIGAASQIVEGTVIDSANISQQNTELDLFGVSSADIIITGGGPLPFQFQLANVR